MEELAYSDEAVTCRMVSPHQLRLHESTIIQWQNDPRPSDAYPNLLANYTVHQMEVTISGLSTAPAALQPIRPQEPEERAETPPTPTALQAELRRLEALRPGDKQTLVDCETKIAELK